jgi:hypothetical protein
MTTIIICTVISLAIGVCVGAALAIKVNRTQENEYKKAYSDHPANNDVRFATIEMRHAWEWTCEECGRDNYTTAISAEMSAEDKQRLLDGFSVVGTNPKSIYTYPDEVTCRFCKKTFETHGIPGDEWKS